MAKAFLLSYIAKKSPIHQLTGATKLICFLFWLIAMIITYDTRLLLFLVGTSLVLFKISRVRFSEIKIVFYMIIAFLVLNMVTLYFFAPEEGVKIYGSRHELFALFGRYTLTQEQLFYQFNIALKYLSVIPIAILFVSTTYPSEFAASLHKVGVPYKVAYAVSIALRYIPTIQEDFWMISKAQQARGIDTSKNQSLWLRIKYTSHILFPLIFASLEKIDIISNAMLLRGFGKGAQRTWYTSRPFTKQDYVAMLSTSALIVVAIVLVYMNQGRFYSPF